MVPDRPHRSTSSSSSNTTSTTSELFICFTSRLSSSSMKIPSKSILSPGRAREPSQVSLSLSLSRRLRSNGSMKGGQASPMFPANGRKRGCAFENPEPSSPKVTCIGQVRVKTKKQGKKFRACRSKRRGEVSFRNVDHNKVNNGSNNTVDKSSFHQDYNTGHFLSNNNNHHHHQQQQQQQKCKKWVHLPVTICEALRALGAEFNCFLPCRSSCVANQRDKEEKTAEGGCGVNDNSNGNGNSSCGAVFAKWLVAVEETEGQEREIELVVSGEDDDDERRRSGEMMRSSQRRHVFEDIEINDCGNENMGDDEEEEGRVSICVPPKNALLLMRCRSDPVKMAALANKFWETPVPKNEVEEKEEAENENESEEKEEEPENAVEVEKEERQVEFEQEMEHQEVSENEANEEQEIPETEAETEAEESLERSLKEKKIIECQEEENEAEEDQHESSMKEEILTQVSSDLEGENVPQTEEENEDGLEQDQEENAEAEEENVRAKEEDGQAVVEEEEEEESSTSTVEEKETETSQERSELECPKAREPDPEDESNSKEREYLLPDCLLLMMCEPKLSMEVSKETWVCSTDFIRWTPEKTNQPLVKQMDGPDEPNRRISVDSNPTPAPAPPLLLQPPRSSCSFPAAPPPRTTAAAAAANGSGGCGSIAAMIQQKLVGSKGYEPFVLTRCKSEPMRSSAKLAPDACFWKNRNLEPATVGVGAAGVGF
ncbi:hypothetical protein PTKIN_Ptkin11bG0137000 [Pterospermum kingtungense]